MFSCILQYTLPTKVSFPSTPGGDPSLKQQILMTPAPLLIPFHKVLPVTSLLGGGRSGFRHSLIVTVIVLLPTMQLLDTDAAAHKFTTHYVIIFVCAVLWCWASAVFLPVASVLLSPAIRSVPPIWHAPCGVAAEDGS